MAKKGCELCTKPARMFCESDEASLCWDCDEKVHAANFLVAKHSRTLLCNVCHLPTPWKAEGPKLAPILSVCHACAASRRQQNRDASSSATSRPYNNEYQVDDGFVSRDESDDEEEEGDHYSDSDDSYDSEEEEEEDDENQVVPWSISSSRPPSPSVSSSSVEGDVSLSSSSKRIRGSTFDSEDEEGCCSSQNHGNELGSSSKLGFQEDYCLSVSSLLRPSKMPRTSDDDGVLNSSL